MNDIEKAIEAYKVNLQLTKEELDMPMPIGEEEHVKEWIAYQETAISALEKQIPKKPHHTYTNMMHKTFGECPNCGHTGLQKDMHIHCWWCGQSLDWSKE